MSEQPQQQQRLALSSVLPVWVVAVVGVVVVGVSAPAAPFAGLLVVFLVCVLLSFALQLATQTKDGLVERISAAATGSFVVVLVATVVVLLTR